MAGVVRDVETSRLHSKCFALSEDGCFRQSFCRSSASTNSIHRPPMGTSLEQLLSQQFYPQPLPHLLPCHCSKGNPHQPWRDGSDSLRFHPGLLEVLAELCESLVAFLSSHERPIGIYDQISGKNADLIWPWHLILTRQRHRIAMRMFL
jgi:hypothetical protein